jgi:DNA-binding LacI/PurR family transcriptional regulator
VVAVNDLNASGLISVLAGRGLRVPEDISTAGFDNTYFIPRLAMVDMHPDFLSRSAAVALHEASCSPARQSTQYSIAIDLVVGNSTIPAPQW